MKTLKIHTIMNIFVEHEWMANVSFCANASSIFVSIKIETFL